MSIRNSHQESSFHILEPEAYALNEEEEEKNPNHNSDQRKKIDSGIITLTQEELKWDDQKYPKIKSYLEVENYDLAILVTAYNEKEDLFTKTFESIQQSILNLVESKKKIAIIFIIDGIESFCKEYNMIKGDSIRESIRNHNREILERWKYLLDLDQLKNLVRLNVGSDEENAYLFCQNYLPYPGRNESFTVLFCIKNQNKKKINTHKWFLKGFCKKIKPTFIIFIDVGTQPVKKSIKYLYDCLENNEDIAGCCGEIIPENTKCSNFIQQAQLIEYKFSHLFDKAFESLFGYVSVLPGAYSAYRYECFSDINLIDTYFQTETNGKISLFNRNMYLAEDRILCLELFCQKGRQNKLAYVPEAQAKTDIIDSLFDLVKQRRRWINGSWFSLIYTILNWKKVLDSNHSTLRKIGFCFLNLYYMINALFTWVLVGLLYLCLAVALKRYLGESNNDLNKLDKFSTPILMFYVSTLIAILICSLSVKPEEIKHLLNFLAGIYAIYTFATLALILNFMLKKNSFEDSEEWMNSTSSLMFLLMILMVLVVTLRNFKTSFIPIIKGIFQYFCLTGAYVNIFLIYSICNINDFTWGNRPDKDDSGEEKASYEDQRATWVVIWIISNVTFSFFFNWTNGENDETAKKFINYLAWIVFFLIFAKVFGGFLFLFNKSSVKSSNNQGNKEGKRDNGYLITVHD